MASGSERFDKYNEEMREAIASRITPAQKRSPKRGKIDRAGNKASSGFTSDLAPAGAVRSTVMF